MQRRTRIWIGLSAAVLVSGTTVDRAALADGPAPGGADSPGSTGFWPPATAAPERLFAAQAPSAEAGEGGPGEGGGQVLGTITEFRLGSTDPTAFSYDASAQVAAYAALVHGAYVAAQRRRPRPADGGRRPARRPLAGDARRRAARPGSEARPAYLRTEAFQFYAGPVDAPGGPLPRLNGWPIDPAFLDGLARRSLGPARLPQPRPAQPGGGARPGHDRLARDRVPALGRGAATGPSPTFVAGEGTNDRRRDYLAAVAQLLVNDLGLLVAAWAPGHQQLSRRRRGDGPAQRGRPRLQRHDRAGGLRDPAAPDRRRALSRPTRISSSRRSATPPPPTTASPSKARGRSTTDAGFDALLAGIDPALAAEVARRIRARRRRARARSTRRPTTASSRRPPAAPSAPTAEAAVRALTDLGRELRQAGQPARRARRRPRALSPDLARLTTASQAQAKPASRPQPTRNGAGLTRPGPRGGSPC